VKRRKKKASRLGKPETKRGRPAHQGTEKGLKQNILESGSEKISSNPKEGGRGVIVRSGNENVKENPEENNRQIQKEKQRGRKRSISS